MTDQRPALMRWLTDEENRILEERMPLNWSGGGGGGGGEVYDGLEQGYLSLHFAGAGTPLRTIIPPGYDRARIIFSRTTVPWTLLRLRGYWTEAEAGLAEPLVTYDIGAVSGEAVTVYAESEASGFAGDFLLRLTASIPVGDRIYYPMSLMADGDYVTYWSLPAGYGEARLEYAASDSMAPALSMDRTYGASAPVALGTDPVDVSAFTGAPIKLTAELAGPFSRADFLVSVGKI
jgi:hypothetical protein